MTVAGVPKKWKDSWNKKWKAAKSKKQFAAQVAEAKKYSKQWNKIARNKKRS